MPAHTIEFLSSWVCEESIEIARASRGIAASRGLGASGSFGRAADERGRLILVGDPMFGPASSAVRFLAWLDSIAAAGDAAGDAAGGVAALVVAMVMVSNTLDAICLFMSGLPAVLGFLRARAELPADRAFEGFAMSSGGGAEENKDPSVLGEVILLDLDMSSGSGKW